MAQRFNGQCWPPPRCPSERGLFGCPANRTQRRLYAGLQAFPPSGKTPITSALVSSRGRLGTVPPHCRFFAPELSFLTGDAARSGGLVLRFRDRTSQMGGKCPKCEVRWALSHGLPAGDIPHRRSSPSCACLRSRPVRHRNRRHRHGITRPARTGPVAWRRVAWLARRPMSRVNGSPQLPRAMVTRWALLGRLKARRRRFLLSHQPEGRRPRHLIGRVLTRFSWPTPQARR